MKDSCDYTTGTIFFIIGLTLFLTAILGIIFYHTTEYMPLKYKINSLERVFFLRDDYYRRKIMGLEMDLNAHEHSSIPGETRIQRRRENDDNDDYYRRKIMELEIDLNAHEHLSIPEEAGIRKMIENDDN